jgi:hypothetical protein
MLLGYCFDLVASVSSLMSLAPAIITASVVIGDKL